MAENIIKLKKKRKNNKVVAVFEEYSYFCSPKIICF